MPAGIGREITDVLILITFYDILQLGAYHPIMRAAFPGNSIDQLWLLWYFCKNITK